MKKVIITVLAIMLVFSLASCGSTNENAKTTNAETLEANNTQADTQAETDQAQDPTHEADPGAASVDGDIILDQEGIRVISKGIEDDDFWGAQVSLQIENNAGKTLTFQPRNVSVNGYMVDPTMSEKIDDGGQVDTSLSFLDDLEDMGIDTITEVEFSLHIYDEDWDTYIDSDPIVIKNPDAGSYTQEYDDSGDVLYNENGIKIVSKGLVEDDFLGPSITTYIENNSGQDITVQVRDVTVNDAMIEPAFSVDILDGKRAISSMTFFSSDLEEIDVETIETVEMYFHIFDLDEWDTIVDTDPVTITF